MAKGNLNACLAVTLPHEGGYVDHPKDPGGATNMGITIGTLRDWRKKPVSRADVRNLTKREASEIYWSRYWTPLVCENLPYGVDCAAFDYGVNSGPARAARALQAVVRTKQTGRVDASTVNAAGLGDVKATIQKLCAQRLGFVRSLKTFSTFGRGWTRRIADVEAKSVAMFLARGGALTVADRRTLQDEGDKAGKAAKQQGSAAGGAAAGGGGVGGFDAATSAEPNWLLIAGLVIMVGLVVVGLIARSRHNRDRAAAYQAASS